MRDKPEPQRRKLDGRGLIMKVLTRWEIIQLFAEFGEATGKTYARFNCRHTAYNVMFFCTWHIANIGRISVNDGYNRC